LLILSNEHYNPALVVFLLDDAHQSGQSKSWLPAGLLQKLVGLVVILGEDKLVISINGLNENSFTSSEGQTGYPKTGLLCPKAFCQVSF